MVDGEPRFVSDPPLLVPVEELLPDADVRVLEGPVHKAFDAYRHTLQTTVATCSRAIGSSNSPARSSGSAVSVPVAGSRCCSVLDDQDPLFLQVKEAEESVMEPSPRTERVRQPRPASGAGSTARAGRPRHLPRVGARHRGLDGKPHDHYIRQLWDWKASAAIEAMSPPWLDVYGQICGWTLARAHARSGDRVAIAAYLGGSDVFDQALARFASLYAEQNDLDHQALTKAIGYGPDDFSDRELTPALRTSETTSTMTYEEIVSDAVKTVEATGAAIMVLGGLAALVTYAVAMARADTARTRLPTAPPDAGTRHPARSRGTHHRRHRPDDHRRPDDGKRRRPREHRGHPDRAELLPRGRDVRRLAVEPTAMIRRLVEFVRFPPPYEGPILSGRLDGIAYVSGWVVTALHLALAAGVLCSASTDPGRRCRRSRRSSAPCSSSRSSS